MASAWSIPTIACSSTSPCWRSIMTQSRPLLPSASATTGLGRTHEAPKVVRAESVRREKTGRMAPAASLGPVASFVPALPISPAYLMPVWLTLWMIWRCAKRNATRGGITITTATARM